VGRNPGAGKSISLDPRTRLSKFWAMLNISADATTDDAGRAQFKHIPTG
jgi:hypothetical protein